MTLAMQDYRLYQLLADGTLLLFMFAFGGCVGSLINVLVYRMPRGMGVVTPASRCPACATRLTWRENIPVFGWIFLRGRCRFCKVKISPEYMLVELFCALLFVTLYLLYYTLPAQYTISIEWLGIDWQSVHPAWASNGFARTWPLFVMTLILVGSLVAMTLVDAKTFMIPLKLAWAPAIVAILAHPAQVFLVEYRPGVWRWALGWSYAIPTPGPLGWGWVGLSIGAVLGLGVGLLLIRAGLIRRSFEDYEQWEREAFPDTSEPKNHDCVFGAIEAATTEDELGPPPVGDRRYIDLPRVGLFAGVVLVCAVLGGVLTPSGVIPAIGVGVGLVVGPVLAAVVGRAVFGPAGKTEDEPSDAEQAKGVGEDPELWLQYPHARREMIRELAFLAPAALLGFLGWKLAVWYGGPWSYNQITASMIPAKEVPLWLHVIAGVFLGYLVGGAVVWAVRIAGSLAFGKEAMGLGDVHLMAAVGACLGWIHPVLAFFAAAFVALYIEVLARVIWGGSRRAMPFGPALAIATVLLIFFRPAMETVIDAWLFGGRGAFRMP
ncbi:MAG: A24 family peptidase [Phycisphaerales bacterium]|nr:A24 family peptidase [Phycisphaerales bacterium]